MSPTTARPRFAALAFAALVLGVLGGAVIVELGLRLLGPPRDADDLRAIHELELDAPWIYGMKPGSVATLPGGLRYEINAHGFRDVERSIARPEGGFRIAVVGDSLAFGWGVPRSEAFPARLEARLRQGSEADGPAAARLEVLNFGVGGYNPYTESALLRGVVLDFEADLVLVQFCINDMNDPTAHFGTHARQRLGALPAAAFPDPARRLAPEAAPSPLERGCGHSRLCTRLRDLYWEHLADPIAREVHRSGARAIARTSGPEWDWLEARYLEMAEASRAAGAAFAVVWFPHVGHAQSPAADPVYDALGALARRHGWPYVDARDAYWRAHARGKLFLDYWHPTALGHDIAAREIASGLACAGLLPPGMGPACAGNGRAGAR